MSEAFKRHLPIWIIMVIALIASVIIIQVWKKSEEPSPEPSSSDIGSDSNQLESIELVYKAAGFTAPVDIAATGRTGDGRLFIVEQAGRVRILDLASGQVASSPLLDITDRVKSGGELGLLGLVFDPELGSRPYVYVNYTRAAGGGQETVIARFTLNGDQTRADAGSQKIILRVEQPFANHNAGDLAFGPDGYLYVPLGDGGGRGDPGGRAQNKKSLLGKILRLSVHTDKPYEVPADNPFVGDDAYRPEIWSWGLRNPWRISFDSQTGDMWIGDVGQNAFEEINHEPKGEGGRNYGWRCWEAGAEYNAERCGDKSNYTFPVAQYKHQGASCGGSVSGGFVYRGQAQPALSGHYFYADYCHGNVYGLNTAGATFTAKLLKNTEFGITTFGVDSAGELYLADAKSGTIYQLAAP